MAERDLDVLLATLDVVRRPGTFTMVTAPAGTAPPADAAAWIVEDEGVTFVVPAPDEAAGAGFVGAWLTLTVHSDLAAVGLTAAVATALADAGIAANVIAAFRHDHLLVPADRADDAIRVLRGLGKPPTNP